MPQKSDRQEFSMVLKTLMRTVGTHGTDRSADNLRDKDIAVKYGYVGQGNSRNAAFRGHTLYV